MPPSQGADADMGKKLVIAEKPSVAASIAKVLGCRKREDGWIEGDGYIVSWCFGHLVEQFDPEQYDKKYAKWRVADLPIIPGKWRYRSVRGAAAQLKTLKGLMDRSDVDGLVEATDAGREGELIFRLVYHYLGCRKPFERLWTSSLEDSAIREGFRRLRPSGQYDSMFAAALCRQRADWLVGMNGTRLYSVAHRDPDGGVSSMGRVQTPTLAMIVQRDREISGFTSRPFWTIRSEHDGGSWWLASGRYSDKGQAEAALSSMRGMPTLITRADKSAKSSRPPELFDLLNLQREANKRYGMSASATLAALQSLYEAKLATYPRTDSRHITHDMAGPAATLLDAVGEMTFPGRWRRALDTKTLVKDSDVSDHPALLPTINVTTADLSSLKPAERNVLRLIIAQSLAAVSRPLEYVETKVEGECAGVKLSAGGKSVTNWGWQAVFRMALGLPPKPEKPEGKEAQKANEIPPLSAGQETRSTGDSLVEGKTQPPKHYTEDTLLAAMEKAGSEDMPDEAERKGIGTSATRAAIIERLVTVGYVVKERQKDSRKKQEYLVSTAKGGRFIDTVKDEFKSPKLTSDWEKELLDIEKGKKDPADFMREITANISGLIGEEKKGFTDPDDASLAIGPVVGRCPWCGGEVHAGPATYACSNPSCGFKIFRNKGFFGKLGHELAEDECRTLLASGKVPLKDLVSPKSGRKFDAVISVRPKQPDDQFVGFAFSFEGAGEGGQAVGKCPSCGGDVVPEGRLYRCKGCGSAIWADVCGHTLTSGEAADLLRGKTITLKGMKSREGKGFSAGVRLEKEPEERNGRKYLRVVFAEGRKGAYGRKGPAKAAGGGAVQGGEGMPS